MVGNVGDERALKDIVIKGLDERCDELVELSLRLHANPEFSFEEIKASSWLTGYLGENNFVVERGICGLPTAFRASYGLGNPVIALLAEYDALPVMGHACGHNIIAASSVGAAVASKVAVDKFGGTVVVLGTPGEEGKAGKILMVQRGAFDGVDAAMIVHPGPRNLVVAKALSCAMINVEFLGRAAHAAAHACAAHRK